MRKKEVLYAVVGGVVGASLAMVAGSFSPLASYAVIGGVVGVTLTMAAGAQNKTGKFEKITCRRLDVVDEEGNALACIVIDQFGGRVIVPWQRARYQCDYGYQRIWGIGWRA